jgi:ribose-phosphate pyrophosphokinase
MSSDAGGFKPLMKLCDKIKWKGEVYSASKSRLLDDDNNPVLYQQVDRQDFGGKDILIVDDICVYGGTFKGLSKLLRQRNCGKLYLAVSHITVKNLGVDPVTEYFDMVFTTNSKYDQYWMWTSEIGFEQAIGNDNLQIINLF